MKVKGKSHATDCTGNIDNISLVFGGYDPDHENHIKACVIALAESGKLVQTKTSRNGYKRNYKYREEEIGGRVLVSSMPVKPGAAPLRVEVNPSALGRKTVAKLVEILSDDILFGGLEEFYERARVTRIDVAFDLLDLALGEAFFWCYEATQSQLFTKEGMRAETIIFNRTKLKKIVVYDKAAEQKAKGAKNVKEPWTRIEVRKRNCGSLLSIKGFKNPLLGFYVSNRKKPAGVGHDFWVLLDASCGPKTTQAVLAKLSPERRQKAKNALMNSLTASWNAHKAWNAWPKIVDESGLMDPLNALSSSPKKAA